MRMWGEVSAIREPGVGAEPGRTHLVAYLRPVHAVAIISKYHQSDADLLHHAALVVAHVHVRSLGLTCRLSFEHRRRIIELRHVPLLPRV